MPVRLCLEPKCPEPAVTRGRCRTHATRHDRGINRAGHRIYRTKRWQILRRAVLLEQPLCPGVFGDTCGALAEHVDHITPLAQGGAPYDRANCQALCAPCHGRKTKQERQAWPPTPSPATHSTSAT